MAQVGVNIGKIEPSRLKKGAKREENGARWGQDGRTLAQEEARWAKKEPKRGSRSSFGGREWTNIGWPAECAGLLGLELGTRMKN